MCAIEVGGVRDSPYHVRFGYKYYIYSQEGELHQTPKPGQRAMADVKALFLDGAEEEGHHSGLECVREDGEVVVTTRNEFTQRLILLKQLRALVREKKYFDSRALNLLEYMA